MSEYEKSLEIQRMEIKKLRDQINGDRETINKLKAKMNEQSEAIEKLGNIVNALIRVLRHPVVIPKDEFMKAQCEPDFGILDKDDVVTIIYKNKKGA